MPTTRDRDRLPEAVHAIMPWVVAAAACVIGSVILSSFIDTLHLSIQRGEAMREALAQQNASRTGTATQLAHARAGQQPAKP